MIQLIQILGIETWFILANEKKYLAKTFMFRKTVISAQHENQVFNQGIKTLSFPSQQ